MVRTVHLLLPNKSIISSLFCCVAPSCVEPEPAALVPVHPRRPDVVTPASDRTLSLLAARLGFRTRLGTAVSPSTLLLAWTQDPRPTQTSQGSTNKPWKIRKLRRQQHCPPIHTPHHPATDPSAPVLRLASVRRHHFHHPPASSDPKKSPTTDRKHTHTQQALKHRRHRQASRTGSTPGH